jgi:hypothetical protein
MVAVVLVIVAFFVVVGMLGAAEVVLIDIRRDAASQIGAGVLIEAKMDAAEDARIADVVRDLVEPRVVSRLNNSAATQSFDVTADGKQIVFDRVQENSYIVLIDLAR